MTLEIIVKNEYVQKSLFLICINLLRHINVFNMNKSLLNIVSMHNQEHRDISCNTVETNHEKLWL